MLFTLSVSFLTQVLLCVVLHGMLYLLFLGNCEKKLLPLYQSSPDLLAFPCLIETDPSYINTEDCCIPG